MTAPVDDGRPPITAAGIHDSAAAAPRAPFTQRQMRAIGDALVNQILARVLLAVAGIEVPLLGKPFAFLASWAAELQQRANDAYAGAVGAQTSANYANAQLLSLTNAGLASDVPGGVALVEPFNGVAEPTLDNFTRVSTGGGAGTFGPNGLGSAVWTRSGGGNRTHADRHNTPLTTRYQVVAAVISARPQVLAFGGQAYTWLRGRCNAADDTFVYLRIGYNSLRIGCQVSGGDTVFDTISFDPQGGDAYHLILGTDVDDREFIVKRNGVAVWSDIDGSAVSMVDNTNYLYVGITSSASIRNNGASQTVPAEIDIFTAADRQPTSI